MLRRIIHKRVFQLMSASAATCTPLRLCVSKTTQIHQRIATAIQPVPGAGSTDANKTDDDGKRISTTIEGLSSYAIGKSEPYNAVVESEEAWKILLEHLKAERVALLRGTAQCGKTSFCLRGVFYSKKPGTCLSEYDVRFVEQCDAQQAFRQFCKLEQDFTKTILVFDEAHEWFAAEAYSHQAELLTFLLKTAGPDGCRVVFVATSTLGDHKLKLVSPADLGSNQFWFFVSFAQHRCNLDLHQRTNYQTALALPRRRRYLNACSTSAVTMSVFSHCC